MSYASFADELRKWWSFDDRQQHTHSWHAREDFIKDRMRELIDAETKPLHARIEKLRAALKPLADEATATDRGTCTIMSGRKKLPATAVIRARMIYDDDINQQGTQPTESK